MLVNQVALSREKEDAREWAFAGKKTAVTISSIAYKACERYNLILILRDFKQNLKFAQ
jgi:hypothetical protein